MKFKTLHISTILLLLIGLNGFAQNDTIKITNGVDSNSTQYLTPMEYAFMFHEDTPWMLKGGLNSRESLFLAFERRIKGGFTANSSIKNLSNILIANLSVRYYYNMKLRNKNRNTPFNLSGNYFSLGYEVDNRRTSLEKETINGMEYHKYKRALNSAYFLKWGMQRRYLKNGFIDAGIKAVYRLNGDLNNSFQLHSVTSIGLAFAKDKSSLNDKNLCSVIKCFESDRSVFKINISNLFGIGLSSDNFGVQLNPEVTHEFKLGTSSFSINNTLSTNLEFSYSINDYNNTPPPSGYIFQSNIDRQRLLINVEYLFESRYYFNLKNRILKGKTGNGLSADYVSIGLFNYYQNDDYIVNPYSTVSYLDPKYKKQNFNFLQPQFTIGSQRFIGDHFYYDLGIGYRMANLIDKERTVNSRLSYELLLYSKVGFRF